MSGSASCRPAVALSARIRGPRPRSSRSRAGRQKQGPGCRRRASPRALVRRGVGQLGARCDHEQNRRGGPEGRPATHGPGAGRLVDHASGLSVRDAAYSGAGCRGLRGQGRGCGPSRLYRPSSSACYSGARPRLLPGVAPAPPQSFRHRLWPDARSRLRSMGGSRLRRWYGSTCSPLGDGQRELVRRLAAGVMRFSLSQLRRSRAVSCYESKYCAVDHCYGAQEASGSE